MSASSSLLVENLWRLKRLVDKGQCPGLQYVHLNNLLRSTSYREDVLNRVEASGTVQLKTLAADIRDLDTGETLMAPPRVVPNPGPATRNSDLSSGRVRRNTVWILAAIAVASAVFTSCITLDKKAVRINADITSNTTWESGKTYRLEKVIYVDNADLNIESGVTVEGDSGAALVITQDSRLFARGRSDSPIVFTSSKPEGQRQRGDWGGVVLLGKAPVNQPTATIEGLPEGNTLGAFGGQDANHSCGVIEYVRVEFAGFEVYKNNELNGLTLGGCGSDTIVRNVQVHRSLDDGIELFGGTVDLKHIVVSGAGDDSIDWDWGWTGRVQFAVIQQHPDVGDNAFEGDNNGDDHNALPRSAPSLYNITLVGAGQSAKKHRGIVLREGSGGHFHNMIVDSYAIESLDFRDGVSGLVEAGQLIFTNNLLSLNGRFAEELGDDDDDLGFDENLWITSADIGNVISQESALYPNARDTREPRFKTRSRLHQMRTTTPPESEFFDESANYQGALNPVSHDSWLDGWTAFPEF